MSHVALYRKYRSQTFGDLIGQEHVVRTLQNAMRLGNVHHAYLFTGPRGTGKTSTARLLAKALNCERNTEGEPCNECGICVSISEGHCMDVVEMDAASEAGVDDVRENIVDIIEYKPTIARYKVFIIDEVHDLSSKAFDALLKTIEEPPGHIIFILATTELHKVPPTIQSRCQKFQFNRASIQDLASRLTFVLESERREFEPAAVQTIARMADGGFRDALSLLEQALITVDDKLTLQHVIDQLGLIRDELVDELLVAVSRNEVAKTIGLVDDIYRSGRDARAILEAMLSRLGELTRAAYGVDVGGTGEATQEAAMRASASNLGPDLILRLRELAADGIRDVRDVSLPKLWLESLLLGFQPTAPAASSQPVVPAPATVRETAAPAVAAVIHTPTPAPSPAPAPRATVRREGPARESEHPDVDEASKYWDLVVEELTNQSKTAGALLGKSAVVNVEGDQVIVGFSREIDFDQLNGKPKLIGAINKLWEARRGERSWTLSFRLSASAGKPDLTESAVELPAEGPRLAEMAREVFKGF